MKKLIGAFMFAMILGVGMASLSFAADDMATPGTQTVKGDLLKIDGEFYVVKDMAGKEIRLQRDADAGAGHAFAIQLHRLDFTGEEARFVAERA